MEKPRSPRLDLACSVVIRRWEAKRQMKRAGSGCEQLRNPCGPLWLGPHRGELETSESFLPGNIE